MAYEYRTSFTAAAQADREETIVDGRFSSSGDIALSDGSVTQGAIYFADDKNTGIYSPQNDGIAFTIGGKNKFQVTEPGNVVITSTEHDKGLEILAEGVNQESRIRIQGKSSGGTSHDWYLSSSRGSDTFNIHNGTTSWLSIADAGTTTFAGDVTVSSLKPRIDLVDTNHNSDFYFINDDGTFAIKDSTNDAGRLTIASNGQTTIYGNCDFSAGIDVTGDNTFAGDVTITAVAGTNNALKIPGWDSVAEAATTGCSISHQSGNFGITNSTGNTYFTTSGSLNFRANSNATTNAISIDTSLDTTFGGNIKVADDKGIDFSSYDGNDGTGTATGNILKDYEIGTWTPTSKEGTLSSATGTYTKIGRMVYAAFSVTFGNSSSGSSQKIESLPFTSINSDAAGGVAFGYSTYDKKDFTSNIDANTSAIRFYDKNGNPELTETNMKTKSFRGIAVYQTTD